VEEEAVPEEETKELSTMDKISAMKERMKEKKKLASA